MNAFQFSINSDAFNRALENFQASLADNSPALTEVAADLREMIVQQFATEGAASGMPWAPLADSTLRKKREARAGILNVTGALLGSLTDAGAPGHVEEVDGQQLIFGSALPYATFHQTGTRRMPARPILAVSAESTTRWLGIVRSDMDGKMLLLENHTLGGAK